MWRIPPPCKTLRQQRQQQQQRESEQRQSNASDASKRNPHNPHSLPEAATLTQDVAALIHCSRHRRLQERLFLCCRVNQQPIAVQAAGQADWMARQQQRPPLMPLRLLLQRRRRTIRSALLPLRACCSCRCCICRRFLDTPSVVYRNGVQTQAGQRGQHSQQAGIVQ